MIRTLILLMLVQCFAGLSQQDTILVDEINIISANPRMSVPGSKSNPLDNESVGGGLVDGLVRSNIYIKNYGAGSLATSSIRGGAAGHTLVLWNGIPLQSPLLGLLDFSLIPSAVGDRVSIQKGGNSTLWGSGAVTGVISLDSKAMDDYKLKVMSSIGSFGHQERAASFNMGNKKVRSTTKINYVSSNRDFNYSVSPNLPAIKQSNARYDRKHLQQDIYYKPNVKTQVSGHLWIHDSYTEVPPLTTQTESEAYQEDFAIRALLNYKYIGTSQVWEAKVGHVLDHNDYYNPKTLTEGINRYSSTFLDFSAYKMISNHTILVGSTYSFIDVTDTEIAESRWSLFTAYAYEKKNIELRFSARQQFVDGYAVPFIPSLGLTYQLFSGLDFRAKISRDYRTPTLNDRFWPVVGDPDLKPEIGWSKELGLDWEQSIGSIRLSLSTTAYHRLIDNWLMWTPVEGSFFWSPKNINQVLSKGLEQALRISYDSPKIQAFISGAYDYTSSAFQTALPVPVVDKGDQLFYTPKHQGTLAGQISILGMTSSYEHRWTGGVTGVNELVEASQVGNVSVSYKNRIRKTSAQLKFAIDNIWDSSYFLIERRPTPGRNYRLTLTLQY